MRYQFKDKKVLVLGLSKSGISAAKMLAAHGAKVFLTESREQKFEDIQKVADLKSCGVEVEIGGHSEKFLEGVDIAVTSPGIPPHSEIIQRLRGANVKVISEIEAAYLESVTPFIAITGTNGKTTTTALTDFIFKTKFNSEACGNYGLPPCDLVDKHLDYYICECSSFQLETTETFTPKISVWTNFTPDHIGWHQGLENYFKAKAKIFTGKQTPQYSVLNAKDKKLLEFSKTCGGKVFLFGDNIGDNCCYVENDMIYFKKDGLAEPIISIKDCPMIGEHNYQNIECAVICAKLEGIENNNIKRAIMEFKVPEHRLEKFAFNEDTIFYNDSKATNPEASLVAINSFEEGCNVVLIAGGRDKNTSLDEFCEAVKKHIKTVILIGEATQRFEENLINNGFSDIIKETSMESAIDRAIELKPEVVLLSPACASFDMFSGYEERGKVFKEYVLSKLK